MAKRPSTPAPAVQPIQRLEFVEVAAQMLMDPEVADRIRDDVGDEAYRELLERARNREVLTFDGYELEDYLTVDPLQGDLYHEFIVKGDGSGVIDDWPMRVRGFGGVYYWRGEEDGEDIGITGYYTSLADAVQAVRDEVRDLRVVSIKGRKYRKAF